MFMLDKPSSAETSAIQQFSLGETTSNDATHESSYVTTYGNNSNESDPILVGTIGFALVGATAYSLCKTLTNPQGKKIKDLFCGSYRR